MKRKSNPNRHLAAIYTRVSTGPQEEEGTSLDTQEKACRAHAAELGLAINEAQVYREVHTGAELWERPALTQLRDAIKEQQVGAVIVYATDRLARDAVHQLVVRSEAHNWGVEFLFVTEQIDESSEGELVQFVRGYAAKIEHEKIRERSLRGKRARVESGKVSNSGGELYGYRREREAGIRHLVPEQAIVVRRIFEAVVDGEPLRAVIRKLNEENVPSPGSGRRRQKDPNSKPRWGKGVVQRMLTNPAYKGEPFAWRTRRDPQTGRPELRPEEEWVRLPAGTTPAIVSPELWQAAQERLAANKGEATRNQRRPYLLRGLIYCAECGLPLQSCPERDRRVYRCSSKDRPGGSCGASRVPADEIEHWVCEQIKEVLNNPATVREELERRRQAGPEPALLEELTSLHGQQNKLRQQIDRLVDAFADGDLPRATVKQKMDARQRELGRIQTRITAIEDQLSGQQAVASDLSSLEEVCRYVAARVDQLGFDGWRLALQALGVKVCASGCGRRKSRIDWRLEGSIPLTHSPPDAHDSVVPFLTRS